MKTSRFSDSQILAILKQAVALQDRGLKAIKWVTMSGDIAVALVVFF